MSLTSNFYPRGLSLRSRSCRKVLGPCTYMGAFFVRQPPSHMVKSTLNGGADVLQSSNDKEDNLLPSPEAHACLEDIKSQLSGLQDLVFKQQELIINQAKELENLKRRTNMGGYSGLSPLESQVCSPQDKRMQGMFDARFHSLHGWVACVMIR